MWAVSTTATSPKSKQEQEEIQCPRMLKDLLVTQEIENLFGPDLVTTLPFPNFLSSCSHYVYLLALLRASISEM
jgi:hypothetical protein